MRGTKINKNIENTKEKYKLKYMLKRLRINHLL